MAVTFEALRSAILLFIFSYLWVRIWPGICHAQTSDTVKQGQVLEYSDKLLVSSDRRFQLGFFNLSDPPKGYLGIWYTNDPFQVKVWVANRETPIFGSNANLTLDPNDGLLKITHAGGDPILLSSTGGDPNQGSGGDPNQGPKQGPKQGLDVSSTICTLETSGNLVVKEVDPSDSNVIRVLWESFENPTNTLLPSMKLGTDLTSGKSWILTSWLTDKIPAPGAFTLECDPAAGCSEGILVIKRRGELYWRSGTEANYTENIKFISENYRFQHVSNKNEMYWNYSTGGNSRWVLSPDGQLITDGDVNTHVFSLANQCYGYSLVPAGCVQQEWPKCSSSRGDKFEKHQGSFVEKSSYWNDSSSISLSDCWNQCWNNCSCVGFVTYNKNDGTGCEFWSNGTMFEPSYDGIGMEFYVLNSSFTISGNNSDYNAGNNSDHNTDNNSDHNTGNNSDHAGNNSSSSGVKRWIWVIAVAVLVVLVLIGLVFLCYLRRKKLLQGHDEVEQILHELHNYVKRFDFASIRTATDDFSTQNQLGKGGFGTVFKGILPEGILPERQDRNIAVKRLSKMKSFDQGLVEFIAELKLTAKLQHVNLVRLLGCCSTKDEKMLIYEYMPNKSLDKLLFDQTGRESLTWNIRYKIIKDIAQGLSYLHTYSTVPIIHRDLKPGNILLDVDMNPKISDLGMARIFDRNVSKVHTQKSAGTYGYMSPEYGLNGNFSEKSDVYSFGVILLEIVSGRKNSDLFNSEESFMNLVAYAWELWKEERSKELTDSTLEDESTKPQILRCIHVGLLCIQDLPADRPTMSNVIPMIANNEAMPLPDPKKPVAFLTGQNLNEVNSSARRKQESYSINEVTISDMEPR